MVEEREQLLGEKEREKERVIYMVARDRDEEEVATWKQETARRG